jgi:hypothetical protein
VAIGAAEQHGQSGDEVAVKVVGMVSSKKSRTPARMPVSQSL